MKHEKCMYVCMTQDSIKYTVYIEHLRLFVLICHLFCFFIVPECRKRFLIAFKCNIKINQMRVFAKGMSAFICRTFKSYKT